MKKTINFVLSVIFFFASSILLAQEIPLKNNIVLDGGSFFNGVEFHGGCSDLFKYKSKGKVQVSVEYKDFFETSSFGKVSFPTKNVGVISFKTRVVKPSVYSESTVKYRILPNFVPGPNYDTNVIPETEEGEKSIIEKVVYIDEQKQNLSDRYTFTAGPEFDSMQARDTLSLSGFFYVIADGKSIVPQSNPQPDELQPKLFSELCTKNSVPFIKTDDGKLLVPVAANGHSATALSWILARYFGIK